MNIGLNWLDEEPILSGEIDDRAAVRAVAFAYPITRDAMLEMHPWNFAKWRASLAAETTSPPFGWGYSYRVPADLLRLLPPRAGGAVDGHPLSYAYESNRILTNQDGPLLIHYIRRVETPTEFTGLFGQALAAHIALRCAQKLTGKASYVDRLNTIAQNALLQAQMVNGFETQPEEPDRDDYFAARRGAW